MDKPTARASPPIEVQTTPVRLTIRVMNIPHVLARKRKIVLIQGFILLRNTHDAEVFVVEYSFDRGEPVRCEYDTREKWESVLLGLEKQDLFGDSI